MATLFNGLGGSDGFGESVLTRGDNFSSDGPAIDLSSVFPNGLVFGTDTLTDVRISTNGYVYFSNGISLLQSGTAITDFGDVPVIAPFFADIDTTTEDEATDGGNSTGSNLVFYDLNPATGTFTVTWDDVGYDDDGTDLLNAFQLILTDRSGSPGRSAGDFDIEFRYEDINWSVGGEGDGLQSSVLDRTAVIGLSSGSANGDTRLEIPGSGLEPAILDLETTLGNVGEPGRWVFEVRNGQVTDLAVSTTLSVSGPNGVLEGDAGATFVTYTVNRSGDISNALDVPFTITASGANPADNADVAGSLPVNGMVSFAANQSQATINFAIAGDTDFELEDTFTLMLDPLNALSGVSFFNRSVTTGIGNDDANLDPVAQDDDFVIDEETPFNGNVLEDNGSGADADADNGVLSVVAVNGEAGDVGSEILLDSGALLTLNADGSFSYDPNGAFGFLAAGAPFFDNIQYTVDDGFGGTDTATMTVTLTGEDAIFSIAPLVTGAPEGSVFETVTHSFTITRSGATSIPASVTYTVSGSAGVSAEASDFVSGTFETGTVDFAAGQTTAVVTVDVLGDLVPEGDESFTVSLSGAAAAVGLASISTASAQGLIVNDDGTFTQTGSGGKDKTKGTSANDVVDGGGGNDKLRGDLGDDVLIGGDGRDKLQGDLGDDVLIGGADADKIKAGLGNDVVYGGTGDDNIKVKNGSFSTIFGEEGADRIKIKGGDSFVNGGAGSDVIQIKGGAAEVYGGDDADNIRGGNGEDRLDGEQGDDIIDGRNGSDVLVGGEGADRLFGNNGFDTIFGGGGDDFVFGGNDADMIYGDAGNDQLNGEAGNDTLWGGEGFDVLQGGIGDDTLHGSDGDTLIGGIGADTFTFEKGFGTAEITDLSRLEDTINLVGYDPRYEDPNTLTRLILFENFTDWRIYLADVPADEEIPSGQNELQEFPADVIIIRNASFDDIQFTTFTFE